MSEQPKVRRFGRGAIAVTILALLVPGVALASHQFTDVPDSNTYHADIDAVADAGVTTGCGDGSTYCPSAFVTREQMAAFMNRLGALQAGKTPVVNATKLDGLNSTDFVRTGSDHFNCLGRDMFPVRNPAGDRSWNTGDSELTRMGTNGFGTDEFACPVHLPDGAVVTAFSAGVYDSSAGALVRCVLYRAEVVSPGATAILADIGTTIDGAPGSVVLEDTTIDNATIDNDGYGYEAVCTVYAADSTSSKLFGVSVEYTT
jgi:hypothetical protein